MIFINKRLDYNIALNKAKIRLSIYIKKPVFQDLYTKVLLFALIIKILSYYNKVISYIIKLYTKYFIIIIELSYIYIIEYYVLERAKILLLEDIYFY